jgi:prolyl oligopeptidase PreP (S9A serine peptidase family)
MYIYDLNTHTYQVWYEGEKSKADISNVKVEDIWYPSSDGTLIPATVSYNKDVLSSLDARPDRPIPTMIFVYGGFGVVQEPHPLS